MKIINIKKDNDFEKLNECANALKNGDLVIFPTETVYGIGANALMSDSVDNIFKAKGRANDNPLIVHISDKNKIKDVAYIINDIEQSLINKFMPGPFTLILKKKDCIPNNVSANLDTVGVRIPTNKVARELLIKANVPVAAPSANVSSRPSGTNIDDIKEEFNNKVEYIIDNGDSDIGIESTVVKVIDKIPVILRPGKVTAEDIIKHIGSVKIDEHVFTKANGVVLSPGMKYKHYAPNCKSLMLYCEDNQELIKLINEYKTHKTIVIGCSENKDKINTFKYYDYGKKDDFDSIAHNIFKLLRKTNEEDCDLVIIEGVKKEGFGISIMNRLIRSVNYNYIEKSNN